MRSLKSRDLLRDQQHLMADIIRNEPAKLIVAPMGVGKSGATLTALRDLHDSFTIRRTLVVAPKLVAKETWPDEIEGWEHTRVLSYAVAVGTEAERRAAIDADAEITIINRENLPWLAKYLKERGRKWPYDCVVVDESSMFKAGAKRTKRARVKKADGTVAMRKGGNITRFGVMTAARKHIDRIYLLTGTPAPNGPHDLWGQAYLLDQGERLMPTITAFRKRWFIEDRYRHTIEVRPGAESEIMDRISDVMVSMPRVDIVPDPVFIPIRVDLPPKVMAEYREFERTLVSESYDVEAVSKGVLANKLLQLSNGSLYRDDGTVAPVHTVKLDALKEIVERAAGDPILCFYSFRFDLEAIRSKFPEAVVLSETPDAVKDWNAGKIKLLLAHPASCAHGLNMQYGGHIAVWYGLTWSLELYQQANARLPRPGQKNIVAIYQIVARNTYDEVALESLNAKGVTQDAIIKAVNRYAEEIGR